MGSNTKNLWVAADQLPANRDAAAQPSERLALHPDQARFCDALANKESAVRERQDQTQTLKTITEVISPSLRAELKTDWPGCKSMRAQLRPMVGRTLKES